MSDNNENSLESLFNSPAESSEQEEVVEQESTAEAEPAEPEDTAAGKPRPAILYRRIRNTDDHPQPRRPAGH